jgi:hypothetical protein
MRPGDHTNLLGKSLRNRAMIANALCSMAEEEYHAGQEERAAETVQTIRHVLRDIWVILGGDVSAVPSNDLREASELLGDLDGRVTAIERAMGP